MRSLITILFAFIYCAASAQNISVLNLMKLRACETYDCALNLLSANEYTYYSTPVKESGRTGYMFRHNSKDEVISTDGSSLQVKQTIVFEHNENAPEAVIYYFTGEENYKNLMTQLSEIGFAVLFSSDKNGGKADYFGTSAQYPDFTLQVTTTQTTLNNKTYTEYKLNIL